jgi:molybdopterin-dependent oxidoreductase alpha subunit
MKQRRFGWNPAQWASLKPFGIGEQRPNNYLELWKALRENRDQLPYAWRILTEGVCDGCALGTHGLRDWTLDGVHLCNIRLRLLRLNTMPPFDPQILADAAALRGRSSGELRGLGRIPQPFVRRRGDAGFAPIAWDDALDLIAGRIRATAPDRLAFYLTSRGMPNESYYAAQKAVRALGSNSIDNAARVCHAPSTTALKEMIGVAATTCSYSDWIGSDLVVFIGSNIANNQPVATKYLYYAKKAGTQVVMVNTYREPGMERYWIPSVAESALFGTKLTDRFFLIDGGGDAAFLSGALKRLIATDRLDHAFIREHTNGFEQVLAAVSAQPWEAIERASGTTRAEIEAFADMLGAARSAVLVWSMGVTQHECGEDNVRAIVNLALARGFLGREKCGLMPIRGHSGVQGGAEMGAYAGALPGGLPITPANAARFAELWGFEIPTARGLTAPEMLDAAADGRIDMLLSAGGNFLEVLPDPRAVEAALARVPLRVHMDIALSSQMFVDPADTVLLLPAATRYEIVGGVTETSTERRVIFSPEIPGPRVAAARAEWQVFTEIAARARPELAARLRFSGTPAIRAEIAKAAPIYAGIEELHKEGDQFQYGGQMLCAGGNCPTADGRARFVPAAIREVHVPPGMFRVATRRGKQFNSIVHERRDALNGAVREAVLISAEDAANLGVRDGDPLLLRNERGELRGRALVAPIRPGNLQVHWPEGNVLIDKEHRSPQAGIPDYNALVRVERIY